jgi:hypothetical protein
LPRAALLTLTVAAGLAVPAAAQTGALVSVGAEAVLHRPGDGLDHSLRPSFLVRLRLKPGLGLSAGIGGFRAGWADTEARIKVRTLFAGPAYRVQRRRVTASVSLLAGYAFSRLEGAPPGQHVRGTVALQPSAGLWYDLSERVGLHAAVGYLVARPSLVVDGPGGRRTTRIRADAPVLRVGMAYAVF